MAQEREQDGDETLVAAVAAGEADAFAELFRRRQGDVFRFALHMTGRRAVAEDVTQDVFLVVMREAARYEAGRSTVAAWLCGIARNCARQRLDRDRRLEGAAGDMDAGDRGPALTPDPVGDLARAQQVSRLRRAVLALPVRYREVLVLCDLQELSYAETAAALGCAIGTVRSRLHRARGLLSARMTGADVPARAAEALKADTTHAGAGSSAGSAAGSTEERGPERPPRRCLA